MIRMLHPAGTKSVQAADGRVYFAENGSVLIPESMANELKLAGFEEAPATIRIKEPAEPTEFAKALEAITRLAAVIEDRAPPVINVTLQQPRVSRTVTAERRADGKLVATIVAEPTRSD